MNDSDATHTHADLSDQLDALRRQTFILLLALVVVSGTLAAFLYYQSRVMAKSVEGVKPQAMQVIQTYNQVTANINHTNLMNFVNQISAFAATHPDFQPILKKYGWNPPAAPVRK